MKNFRASFSANSLLLLLVSLAASYAAQAATAIPVYQKPGPSAVAASVIHQGDYDLYAVATSAAAPGLIWMGGWQTAAEVGPDRLYQGQYNGTGQIQNLQPLNFLNPGYVAGYVKDFHANDPTVIQAPTQPWLFMYYTLLSNAYGTTSAMMNRNWVGMASSSDGGASWTNRGVIIGQTNGIDARGAWAPSAVPGTASDIWLYYNTSSYNCPDAACTQPAGAAGTPVSIYRTRLASNGWAITDTVALQTPSGPLINLVNVDVAYANGLYYLVADSGINFRYIKMYISADGVNFVPYNGATGDATLIDSGVDTTLYFTPHIRVTSPPSGITQSINLFFSTGPSSTAQPTFSNKWTIQLTQ